MQEWWFTMDKQEIEKKVADEVATVVDPDLRMSLSELGLIYGIDVDEDYNAYVTMTLTSMACPAGPYLQNAVMEAAQRVDGIKKANVEIVWEPRWDPREMASEEAQVKLGLL